MPNKPLYIAYYTHNTPYEHEAKKLRESLERFELPYEITSIPSFGSWQANTHYKAIFIQNMLYRHPERPLVYLDVDAVVKSYPLLFEELSCDIAAHRYTSPTRPKGELLSGTLYIAPTDNCKKLIQLWRYINQEYPSHWEQTNLSLAIQFMPDITFFELPPAYCQIYDLMKDRGEPVIEHFQASRQNKNIIDGI